MTGQGRLGPDQTSTRVPSGADLKKDSSGEDQRTIRDHLEADLRKDHLGVDLRTIQDHLEADLITILDHLGEDQKTIRDHLEVVQGISQDRSEEDPTTILNHSEAVPTTVLGPLGTPFSEEPTTGDLRIRFAGAQATSVPGSSSEVRQRIAFRQGTISKVPTRWSGPGHDLCLTPTLGAAGPLGTTSSFPRVDRDPVMGLLGLGCDQVRVQAQRWDLGLECWDTGPGLMGGARWIPRGSTPTAPRGAGSPWSGSSRSVCGETSRCGREATLTPPTPTACRTTQTLSGMEGSHGTPKIRPKTTSRSQSNRGDGAGKMSDRFDDLGDDKISCTSFTVQLAVLNLFKKLT